MYLVLALLLVGIGKISALTDEMQKLSAMLHAQCTKETGASDDQIRDANMGIFSDDPKLKCYMKCVMIAATLMDEDGRFDMEAVMDLVPEPFKNLVRPIAKKCESVVGTDLCDLAFEANKCFQTNGPAYYYLA